MLVTVNAKWGFGTVVSRASYLSKKDRLKRLARRIDALTRLDQTVIQRTREITALRRQAALELHAVCAAFVRDLDALLNETSLELDPTEPAWLLDYRRYLDRVDKVCLSNRLQSTDWENSRILRGDLAEILAKLRRERKTGNIMLEGGPETHRPGCDAPIPEMQIKLHHEAHPAMDNLADAHNRLTFLIAKGLRL